MRIIRHSLNNRIRGAVLIVLSILLVGLIPIRTVFAASQEVSVPYKQIWSNKSGEKVDNSFEYRLTAVDGAPLPDEATGEYYSFTLKGNASGDIKLHFPFTGPGYYNYLIRAYISDRKEYYSYDEKTYDLMIMVVNTDSGLGVGAMTLQDSTLAKYPELPYSVAYTKEPTEPVDPGGDDPEDDPTPTPTPTPAPAFNGGNGGAAAPGGVAPADPTVIDDPETPTAINDPEPPKTILPDPEDWALLNLILMVLTVIVAIADGLLYFRRPTDKYGDEYEETEDDEVKRHGLPRILAFIIAIASFILFILTEDITDPMIWVDEYTMWQLLLFVAAVILSMLSKKEYEDEESGQMAT